MHHGGFCECHTSCGPSPFDLGMLRKLEVAAVIDALLPPHPDNVLSCGRGVEALVLAILDGHHALYKVDRRPEARHVVVAPARVAA